MRGKEKAIGAAAMLAALIGLVAGRGTAGNPAAGFVCAPGTPVAIWQ